MKQKENYQRFSFAKAYAFEALHTHNLYGKSPLKRGLKLCSAPVTTSVHVQPLQHVFSMLKYWGHGQAFLGRGALHSFSPRVCSTNAYAQKMQRFPSAYILLFCAVFQNVIVALGSSLHM
jgi:hypothetical protein